ncbi:MAG: hypothetical protein AB7O62_14510 [Pirellulales bacterium]
MWNDLRWFFLLLVPPAGSAVAAGLRAGWSQAMAAALVGLALSAILFVQTRFGFTSSNWATYDREKQPLGYWMSVAFIGAFWVGTSVLGYSVSR